MLRSGHRWPGVNSRCRNAGGSAPTPPAIRGTQLQPCRADAVFGLRLREALKDELLDEAATRDGHDFEVLLGLFRRLRIPVGIQVTGGDAA